MTEPTSARSQWLALLFVVLASAALGLWPTWWQLDVALAVSIVSAAVVRPPLGLAALIAASLTSPLAIDTGTETKLTLGVLLVPTLTVVWGVRSLLDRDLGALSSRPMRALGAFLLISTVALVCANLPWIGPAKTAPIAAQLGQLAIFFFSAGVFFLAAEWIRDLGTLARLTWLFLLLGGLLALARATPEFAILNRLFQDGAEGSLLWTWLVAMAFGQAAFNHHLGWRARSLLGFSIFTVFYVGFGDNLPWISGWLPPGIAVFVALCVGAPRLGLLLALAGSAISTIYVPQVIRLVSAGGNLWSLETRVDAWRIILDIIARNPIVGLGPANYYHVATDFPIRGYAVSFSSHNQYVDIVAQTGILGLICFGWFAWEIGRVGWQLRARVPPGFARGYVYGALGGLIGTLAAGMLGDWILPFVYNVTLKGFRASAFGWLFLGSLLALSRIVGPASKAGDEI